MRNILTTNITKTPYELGYCNEGNCDNEIELLFQTPDLSSPYLEITKQDSTIESTSILEINNNQISYKLAFDTYKTPGTMKIRIIANGYSSDYISFTIPKILSEADDVIVKLEDSKYLIRKITTSSSSSSTGSIILKRW